MNGTQAANGLTGSVSGWRPVGRFLDRLPAALYAAAHVMFLVAGVWLWMRANDSGLPYSGAIVLYAISQLGFLAYFANAITMKTAVLLEQTLVFAALIAIVLSAT